MQTEFKPNRRGTNDSSTRIIMYNQATAENRKISVSNRDKTLDVQAHSLDTILTSYTVKGHAPVLTIYHQTL